MGAGEQVVAASELADALRQIWELQRMLVKKAMENEILRKTAECGYSKNGLCTHPSRPGEDR